MARQPKWPKVLLIRHRDDPPHEPPTVLLIHSEAEQQRARTALREWFALWTTPPDEWPDIDQDEQDDIMHVERWFRKRGFTTPASVLMYDNEA